MSYEVMLLLVSLGLLYIVIFILGSLIRYCKSIDNRLFHIDQKFNDIITRGVKIQNIDEFKCTPQRQEPPRNGK